LRIYLIFYSSYLLLYLILSFFIFYLLLSLSSFNSNILFFLSSFLSLNFIFSSKSLSYLLSFLVYYFISSFHCLIIWFASLKYNQSPCRFNTQTSEYFTTCDKIGTLVNRLTTPTKILAQIIINQIYLNTIRDNLDEFCNTIDERLV